MNKIFPLPSTGATVTGGAGGATVDGVSDSDFTSCYRHKDRSAGVICQRCDKPICPDCMSQASVGFHCPECSRSGKQRVISGLLAFDPIVAKVLIGLNLAAFVAAGAWGGRPMDLGPKPVVELALRGDFVDDGEIYRLVTSAFLHDGLMHLAFNMWALWVIGPILERVLGRSRFIGLYTVSLLGGSFGALLVEPRAFTVGASGAIFGMFGAMAMAQRASGQSIWAGGIGPILGINLFLTFAIPFISVGGHLGGLVAGALTGAATIPLIRAKKPDWQILATQALIGVVFLAGAVWAAGTWVDPIF